ncbi:C-C chemokine receptor type 5-like isoform X2 [Paramisgurnus dabryanus]|uniref:C-C chemokine receptor type 5-like isoform X2 n=1 Tax=Paramisgurnus dabryanus TaxID=90735 RepID=UPI003CCF9B73
MTENLTATDYGEYYENDKYDYVAQSSNNGNTKAFSEVFLPTFYSIVFIIGFIGNGLVVWVLIRYRRKSNMTDVCLLNLAISDLLFLLSLPFWAHSAMADWIFGKFMCHTVTGLYTLGLYGSIFFMVLMTVDRYVIIVHPHSIFSKNRSAKMGLVLAVIAWILSLFASLPNIKIAHESKEMNNSTYCRSHYSSDAMKSFIYFETQGYLQSHEWHNSLSLTMQWVETIAYSHCCLNPIIYGFVGEKFRREVIKVVNEQFPMCFRQCSSFSQQLSERRDSTEYSSTHI